MWTHTGAADAHDACLAVACGHAVGQLMLMMLALVVACGQELGQLVRMMLAESWRVDKNWGS